MDIPRQYLTPPPESYLSEIRAFLNGGGDPNQQDQFGDTLMHVSARVPDSYEAVKELIAAGSGINRVNFLGQTPLHVAVIRRNRRVVNVLIEYGALVNVSDCFGNTMLHFAVKACVDRHWNCAASYCSNLPPDMDTIKKLLYHSRVNVNARNSRGYTPLFMAVMNQNLKSVQALLFAGRADVNIGNCFNVTPLHVSVAYPNTNLQIAFALLIAEACVCCLNNNGHNALDLINERVLKGEPRAIADLFLMYVAFFKSNNLHITSSFQRHPSFLTHYRNCSSEINLMRIDMVATNISMFEFLYKRIMQRCDPQIHICKVIINLLRSGRYPLYFPLIVDALKKDELFSILKELVTSYRYENVSNSKLYFLIVALNANWPSY